MTDEKPTCPCCKALYRTPFPNANDKHWEICKGCGCMWQRNKRRAPPLDATMERMDLERLLAGNYRTLDPQWQPIADKLRGSDSDYQPAPEGWQLAPKEPLTGDEREAFEKWYDQTDPDFTYSRPLEAAWQAWQARASLVPSAGESSPQPAMWPDPHDDNPHAGQCCNRASRKVFGDCPYCGRKAK